MKPFIGSRILYDRSPGLGRAPRVRTFLVTCAVATIVLAAVWGSFAWFAGQWGLLVGDLGLMAIGALVLALIGIGWIGTAIHALLLGLLTWIASMAFFVSGTGVGHEGAVHYWLFVVLVGLHFVLFDARRTLQTFYVSISILLFVVIEYGLVPLAPGFAFPDHDRLFSHGLTLGLVFIALWLMMRSFINSLSDAEQRAASAMDRTRQLLESILPRSVAVRLEREGTTFAERYEESTILFADIVGFTPLASRLSPEELVALLNQVFSTFDALAQHHGLEKIKTIGDGYMAAAGIPEPRADHSRACADMALEMMRAMQDFDGVELRIGVHSGPVVAGVIGRARLSFDVWGEAVNVASRLESHCQPGCIQISRTVRDALDERYEVSPCGNVALRGAGEVEAFLLTGRR